MISPTKRGMCVEYEAIILFTKAGFEVFHNANPDGPADLIVWDGENTYPIDCKKTTKYIKKDGSPGYCYNSRNPHPNVYYLGWNEDGWIWLSEPPEGLREVI